MACRCQYSVQTYRKLWNVITENSWWNGRSERPSKRPGQAQESADRHRSRRKKDTRPIYMLRSLIREAFVFRFYAWIHLYCGNIIVPSEENNLQLICIERTPATVGRKHWGGICGPRLKVHRGAVILLEILNKLWQVTLQKHFRSTIWVAQRPLRRTLIRTFQ